MKTHHGEIPLSLFSLVGGQQTVVIRTVAPGSYFHIGLEKNLCKIIDYVKAEKIDEIILDIGIDGLPIFKSSEIGLWPILGRIVNLPMVKVFLIGTYVGKKKPFDVDNFLHDLVSDLKKLKDGFLYEDYNINIKIRAFVCDTPCRTFICGIRGHNSLNGCSKCEQKGSSISRVTTFCTSVGKLRSDDDFLLRIDKNFHQSKFLDAEMSLETIGIKMISQFPLDVMHLVDLGVTKRMLTLLWKSKANERICAQNKAEMSSFFTSLQPFIPREFARKPRSFDELPRWKAVEFRQFVLYSGIIVFKKFVSEQVFNHFLNLSCAYRLLMSSDISDAKICKAHDMLKHFVQTFSRFYGESSVTHNVHNLLHLEDVARQFGNISNINAYPFENAMKDLKKSIKKPQQIEQQLFNAFLNKPLLKKVEYKGTKRNSKGKIISYSCEIGFFSNKSQDCYCLIIGNIPVKITSFCESGVIEANVFLSPKDMFLIPVKSGELGIFIVNSNSYEKKFFKIEDICAKLLAFPYDLNELLIPLVHTFK